MTFSEFETYREWQGIYNRIPGASSVFHVRNTSNGWRIFIDWERDDFSLSASFIETPNVKSLTIAINKAKNTLSGGTGGSFIINEFSQVLVPSSDASGKVLYIGDFRENLRYIDPETGEIESLLPPDEIQTGDQWKRPYIGMPFSLSHKGMISVMKKRITHDGEEKEKIFPPKQDKSLVSKLRQARNQQGCRFIVNPAGVVLTKNKINQKWKPVYVGKINPECWFISQTK